MRSAASALLGLVETDCEALADALVAKSARPEVAAMIRPDLPKMLRAMLAGAHIPGPGGMGERANAFRLAGLPTERPKDEADEKGRLGDVAARLERALGMRAKVVEAHVQGPSGHEDDTGQGAEPVEAPENLRFDD